MIEQIKTLAPAYAERLELCLSGRPGIVNDSHIGELCRAAIAYGVRSVCVDAAWVGWIRRPNISLRVTALVGFPYGTVTESMKRSQIARAIEDGANEVVILPDPSNSSRNEYARSVAGEIEHLTRDRLRDSGIPYRVILSMPPRPFYEAAGKLAYTMGLLHGMGCDAIQIPLRSRLELSSFSPLAILIESGGTELVAFCDNTQLVIEAMKMLPPHLVCATYTHELLQALVAAYPVAVSPSP